METRSIRILYVDDDPGLQRLVRRHLERAGHSVTEALTADDGLARLGAGGFDVVALDHYLPDRTGIDVLGEMARMKAPPPVVYVTGTQESRVAIGALKAGAADYVIKDVDGGFFELLETAIEGAFEAAELRRARKAAEAEVRAARDRFEALAAERELLMREVNHRVSNSLQLIASFLQLQMRTVKEPETVEVLETAIQRVHAVARVHQRLHTAAQIGTVSLDTYFTALADDLASAGPRADAAPLTVSAEPIVVSADQAVAIGVIVTELVINARKYAYPDGEGPIRLSVRRCSPERAVISVEDDGVGRPPEADSRSTGLGTRILGAMAAKLDAAVGYAEGPRGTHVVVEFPLTETQ